MLGWAGLGHTNCAFITNYAPLILTNYIWHLPPPATSSLLSPHTQPVKEGEDISVSVLVDGVQFSAIKINAVPANIVYILCRAASSHSVGPSNGIKNYNFQTI